jgi:hypothetical protein
MIKRLLKLLALVLGWALYWLGSVIVIGMLVYQWRAL